MRLVVEHIGKIRKADIRIDGITVVAGPNGSGKSTVGRVLMTICSALRRWPSRISDERLKSARESVDGILKSHAIPEVSCWLFETDADLVEFLRPESWKNCESVERRLQDAEEYFFYDDRNAHLDAEKIFAVREEIIGALKNVQGHDSDYYLPSILADSFTTALSKGFSSARTEQDQCSVRLATDEEDEAYVRFGGDKVLEHSIPPAEKTPLVFYFEPVHLLDWYANIHRGPIHRLSATRRYHAPDVDWQKFLFEEADKSEWSVERKKKHEEIETTLDELLNVMRGHLERQGRELLFVDSDVAIPVPVMNVASGIKTMSVIEKGIRAGVIQPGCLLIIDEPESNLHPQWQIEFAQFLVKLNAKFHMRLLLNTHSPFFLKAVEVFSREEGCGERTHYYHMATDTGIGYDTKELKDGTNEIFQTYFDAMNDLLSR